MRIAPGILPAARTPAPPAARLSLLPLLEGVAGRSPASGALLAPGRDPLCYADLVGQVHATRSALRSLGYEEGDRIAVALPDSPELAVMMVAAVACCAAVPLNPRATQAELERQLLAVRARAVVVPAGGPSAARAAAARIDLPAIELRPLAGAAAGRFELETVTADGPVFDDDPPGDDRADDLPAPGTGAALVVHTSGTTGFPKVVPLTQDNLLSMMLANCDVLGLTPLDRCLSVMPLCHIHGLGAVLCTLLSGGSVVVTPGFNPDAFFEWLGQFAPTWYTAVPAIHQQVVERAPMHEAVVKAVASCKTLRFVRSGSAPMPPGVPERLERLFGTNYVEACGATEASAYICSNRPGRGRIGSVGMPMPGTDVRVIDSAGRPVGAGVEGELVARGPGVFGGYENNPAATAAAFVDGYFRTGDLARYDEDGFFYLTGRIKEQINRGGTKVSPYEVEDALLRHPDVVQAVAFAMPDALLGEEVAAAVVLRGGAGGIRELELQRYAATLLADHKVPRRVVFVEKVPAGPTGKVSRLTMARQLGLGVDAAPGPAAPGPAAAANEPVTPTEQVLAAVWSEVVGRRVGDVEAPFESLGVDSLQAVRLSLAIEKRVGRSLPLAALATHRSIRAVAALLESDGWRCEPGAPVVLREGDRGRPVLFVLPGIGGNVYSYYALAQRLPAWQRVVGLPLPGADGLEEPLASIDALADRFAAAVRREQPEGPYLLSGYSFGGRVAFEVARRLIDADAPVKLLAMFDTPAPGWPPPLALPGRVALHVRRLLDEGPAGAFRRAASRFRGRDDAGDDVAPSDPSDEVARDAARTDELPDDARRKQAELVATYQAAGRRWRPQPLGVRIALLRAEQCAWKDRDVSDPAMGWSALATGGVDVTTVTGAHATLFHGYNVAALAARVAALIEPPFGRA